MAGSCSPAQRPPVGLSWQLVEAGESRTRSFLCFEYLGSSLRNVFGCLPGLQQDHMQAWDLVWPLYVHKHAVAQKCWVSLGWSLSEILLLQMHAGIWLCSIVP